MRLSAITGTVRAVGPRAQVWFPNDAVRYQYAEVIDSAGRVVRLGAFRAPSGVDHGLAEGAQVTFVMTHPDRGDAELLAADIDGERRVMRPLRRAVRPYASAWLLLSVLLMPLVVGIFMMLASPIAFWMEHRARRQVIATLRDQGFLGWTKIDWGKP